MLVAMLGMLLLQQRLFLLIDHMHSLGLLSGSGQRGSGGAHAPAEQRGRTAGACE
jgi:hypothetical protein